jgi:hypothetical protein
VQMREERERREDRERPEEEPRKESGGRACVAM